MPPAPVQSSTVRRDAIKRCGRALFRHGPAEQGFAPARPCSDAVFLRRVYLDVIGTLPTPAEAEAFLADRDPRRRAVLIDRLLERDAFADYWAMRWADMLRVKAEFPIKLWPKVAQAYYRWIVACIAENRPYDRLAREMLLATGSNFYVPEVNFYRAMPERTPERIGQCVAVPRAGGGLRGKRERGSAGKII